MTKILALLALCGAAFAQTYNVTPPPKIQFFDTNGKPLANGYVYTYAVGTTTPLGTFSNKTGTPNTNPLILDSGGFANTFLDTSKVYKFAVCKGGPCMDLSNPSGTLLYTQDGVASGAGGSGGTAQSGAVLPVSCSTVGSLFYLTTSSSLYVCNGTAYVLSPIIPTSGTTVPTSCTVAGSLFLNSASGQLYSCQAGQYSGLSAYLDIRNFGAIPFTGNCHALSSDDEPNIQAALNYAAAHGPAEVFIPPGFCFPIGRHLWVPPGVHLFGSGRNFGNQISSTGSQLIANTSWAANNTTYPYSAMVWQTGNNQTSGTFLASGGNFGSELNNFQIECNDQVGCSNWFAVGRQEKARGHDLLLTGGVPFGGGYAYGFYEEGVDCGGGGSNTPPGHGCLFAQDPGYSGNAFSGQQGPDERIEIFPSYSTPSPNFILWAEMGANNYKGLRDSTLNGIDAGTYAIPYSGYFWGEETTMGPGIHSEGIVGNKSFYIGNIPAGSTCNGASQVLFTGFDSTLTIANCGAQQNLSFVNDAGGIINNQSGAPVTTVTDTNYFYDQQTQTSGWIGSKNPAYSSQSIILSDPAEYIHNGHNGINFFNGTTHSGLNEQVLLDGGAAFTRAHVSSNIWWNDGASLFNLGGNGGTDYGSIGFVNGGVCTAATGGASSTFTMATWLGQCWQVVSGNHHVLIGPGWLDTTTGLTQNETSEPLQVNGNIRLNAGGTFAGSIQIDSSSSTSCPTGSSAFSTCTFTVSFTPTYGSPPRAVCTLQGATGAASIQGVTTSTSTATVTVMNGQGSQAIASGAAAAVCLLTP